LKENPYTKQESIKREELLERNCWTGYNERPGMADLRPLVLKRDEYICQLCDKPVSAETAEVDHIKRVSRFKRPVDANRPENLWTLCIGCHREKTKLERQMESRMR
jgi:RNA-directed DNA polymerase